MVFRLWLKLIVVGRLKKKNTKYSFQKEKAPTFNTSTNKRNASVTSLSNVPCVSITSDNVINVLS